MTDEGIETVMQVDLLKTLGCAQGQGYYFSEAVDEESATELIQRDVRGELRDFFGEDAASGTLLEMTGILSSSV